MLDLNNLSIPSAPVLIPAVKAASLRGLSQRPEDEGLTMVRRHPHPHARPARQQQCGICPALRHVSAARPHAGRLRGGAHLQRKRSCRAPNSLGGLREEAPVPFWTHLLCGNADRPPSSPPPRAEHHAVQRRLLHRDGGQGLLRHRQRPAVWAAAADGVVRL